MQFDNATKSFVKRESPVTFPKDLYIDRYMVEHKEETTKRRVIVHQWKEELAAVEKELRTFTHFKAIPIFVQTLNLSQGRNHGLDEALQSVLDYCQDKSVQDHDEAFQAIRNKLATCLERETATMTGTSLALLILKLPQF